MKITNRWLMVSIMCMAAFVAQGRQADVQFPTATYVVIDLSGGNPLAMESLDAVPATGWTDEHKTTKLVLRRIEPDGNTVKKPYYMGVFETTRMQYALLMGQATPEAETAMIPVSSVSYTDLRGSSDTADWPLFSNVDSGSFMWTLRQKTGLAFDLPTEAQWEYACRAGTDGASQWNDGSDITGMSTDTNLNQLALYGGNNMNESNGTATVVGSFNPNGWGLHDMHGNVGEWCLDWYGAVTNGNEMDGEPVGCLSGTSRSLRGGHYHSSAQSCRSISRIGRPPSQRSPYFGFRMVIRQASAENEDAVSIRFDANAGSVSESKRKYRRGAEFGNLPVPARSGYLFTGWFTAPEGGTIKTATDTADATQTLYAHWTYRTDNLYMVVDLSEGTNTASYPITYLSDVPEGGWTDEYKTEKLVLRRIDPGTFMMGSPTNEYGRYGWTPDQEARRTVTLKKPYYIGIFEFTQRQYELITGTPVSSAYVDDGGMTGNRPAYYVYYTQLRGSNVGTNWPASSAVDNNSIMGKLRARTGLTFDLPTEAQWEYACRAGTGTALNNGNNFIPYTKETPYYPEEEVLEHQREVTQANKEIAGVVARFYYNYSTNEPKFAVVGSYAPNAWGLYDMHGNVRERCLDWYGELSACTYKDGEPVGPASGKTWIMRGGSAAVGDYHFVHTLRSAARSNQSDSPYQILPEDGCRIAVQDTTLAEAAVVTVAFNPNGGTVDQTLRTYADGSAYGTLPVPTREDGTFLGWFTAATGGKEIAANSKVAGSLTLYAHWDVPEAATTTTPVAVPHAWLEEEAPKILAAADGDYEAAAMDMASNGVSRVWECYLQGVPPEDAEESFRLLSRVEDGEVVLWWEPDLGAARSYALEGVENMGDEWGETNASTRFYRARVSMP